MDTREKAIYRITLVGTAVNALSIVLKLVAGILGRSSAMIADAVHSLSDFVTDLIVLVFVRVAGKPSDKSHDYGHGKFETMATMLIGIILIFAGIGLMYNGIQRIMLSLEGHGIPRPTYLALSVAVISILSKEWLYRVTVRKGRELHSQAVIANAWHHRSDAVSSVGTLIGVAGAMFLGPRWHILDPVAAVVVSMFIVKSGYDITRPCFGELLDASLPEAQEKEIMRVVMSVSGVKAIGEMRTRRIGNNIAVDICTKMDGGITLSQAHSIASAVEKALRDTFGRNSIISVHMEPLCDK